MSDERSSRPWVIEKLTSAHNRRVFECGDPQLDNFIRTLATQYARRDLAQTYVAVASGQNEVLGYYTLSNSAVDCHLVPESHRRKLPNDLLVPILLLGRPAVAEKVQRRGLGSHLLVHAMQRASQLSEVVGIAAMALHARDERARRFYARFEFVSLLDDELHLYVPMKVIREVLAR